MTTCGSLCEAVCPIWRPPFCRWSFRRRERTDERRRSKRELEGPFDGVESRLRAREFQHVERQPELLHVERLLEKVEHPRFEAADRLCLRGRGDRDDRESEPLLGKPLEKLKAAHPRQSEVEQDREI